MAGTKSSSTTVTINSDVVRAFAEALDNGFAGTLQEFAESEAGQAAATAVQDQRIAALRSQCMADAKAIWRDFKNNGKLTTYSADHAGRMLALLSAVDLSALPAPATDAPAEDTTEADTTEPAAS